MKKERKSQCANSVYSMWDPKTKAGTDQGPRA